MGYFRTMADQTNNPNSSAVKTVSFAKFRQGFESEVKKRHESLMELFPMVDPDFLFGKAVEFEGLNYFNIFNFTIFF